MLVCHGCQELGKPYEEPALPARPALRHPPLPRLAVKKRSELPKDVQELEVADDYAQRVRKQRMKLALSQEDLAKHVKEKLSVIQKIETGKMVPDMKLCRELQHELRVKLLLPHKETSAPKTAAPAEVTLGDIVRIKGKSKTELLP